MQKYNKILLAEQARLYDFLPQTFEKVLRLTEILRFINNTEELRDVLALKGGTAINLTMFRLPRLSVDIDLDFAQNLPRETMLERRDRVNALLGRFMLAEGYALHNRSKQSFSLDSFVYSYTNTAGNLDNIKLEINYSLRCHVLPSVDAHITTDAFAYFPIRTLAPVEIFGSKLVALISRAAARDLYDINNMIVAGLFDSGELQLLRKCTVFYLAIAGTQGIQVLSPERLSAITQRKIKTDLFPVISNSERFDFNAARQRVSEFLEKHMILGDNENEFLACFASGHYSPELLFESNEILARVREHPMALWRVQKRS